MLSPDQREDRSRQWIELSWRPMIPQGSSHWLLAAGLACAISVAWMILWAPPNMTEVTPFHRLACQYPQAHFHVFREGCNLYRIDFGPFGYYRPFKYLGATSGVLYWPI